MSNLTIDEYISITRFSKGAPKRSEMISTVYSLVTKYADKSFVVPRLFVCNSTDRVCETTDIKGISSVIIDDYLFETFTDLNRIMTDNKSDHSTEVDLLIAKLSMEYLYIDKGIYDPITVLHYAHALDEFRRSSGSRRIETIQTDLFVQMFFVIFHELMHAILKQKNLQEYIDVKRRHFLDDYSNLDLPSLNQDDAIRLILPIEYQECQNIDEFLRGVNISELSDLVIKTYSDHERFVTTILKTKDDVIEECICDQFAALMTVELFVNSLKMEPAYIILLIHLTILYLEVLWLTRELLVNQRGPVYIAEKQIRKDIFRLEMPALIQARIKTKRNFLKKCDSMLV